jgi:hypothetical protein
MAPETLIRNAAAGLLVGYLLGGSWVTRAQELEPRTYSPNPVGLNFVTVGVARSSGDVLFDPALPIEDVKAQLTAGVLAYGRTFGVLNRSAIFAAALPYTTGSASGAVRESRQEVHRSGLGDARIRIGINLIGGDALSPERFAQRKSRPVLGASLLVVAPTGQYDSSRLVNIGSNRWAFKPELGFSYPAGRFFLEAYAGVWLFRDNTDYFGGSRRSQDPLTTWQAHVSYTFRRNAWIAADATHYAGGRTQTDGISARDQQSNTRVGLTVSLPLRDAQSIKLAWSRGTTVRFGGNFQKVSVAWQRAWLD